MSAPLIVQRPSFCVVGKSTWISGPDSSLFAAFWQRLEADGTVEHLRAVAASPGRCTGSLILGVSCVQNHPAMRAFRYLVGVEVDGTGVPEGFETLAVPAALWATFPCQGALPDALVEGEMFAMERWLPRSPYVHAAAPELEVYLPHGADDAPRCEFWLPIIPKDS